MYSFHNCFSFSWITITSSIGPIVDNKPVIGMPSWVFSVKTIGLGREFALRRVSLAGNWITPLRSNDSITFWHWLILEVPASLYHSRISHVVAISSVRDSVGKSFTVLQIILTSRSVKDLVLCFSIESGKPCNFNFLSRSLDK